MDANGLTYLPSLSYNTGVKIYADYGEPGYDPYVTKKEYHVPIGQLVRMHGRIVTYPDSVKHWHSQAAYRAATFLGVKGGVCTLGTLSVVKPWASHIRVRDCDFTLLFNGAAIYGQERDVTADFTLLSITYRAGGRRYPIPFSSVEESLNPEVTLPATQPIQSPGYVDTVRMYEVFRRGEVWLRATEGKIDVENYAVLEPNTKNGVSYKELYP